MSPKTISPSAKPLSRIALSAAIVVAGTLSGFGLSRAFSSNSSSSPNITESEIAEKGLSVGDIIGNPNETIFSDPAEGVVEVGGISGEGSHRLLREGGPQRNVYLTSSVIDLNLLVGHRVKVWGETYAAQTAGWLMDVGRAQVLTLNAEKPFDDTLPE